MRRRRLKPQRGSHARGPPPRRGRGGARARARRALPAGVDVEPELHVDDPADVLLRISEHVDLLVCGSRGYGPLRSVLLGGVSRRLVDEGAAAPCSCCRAGRRSRSRTCWRRRRRRRGAMTVAAAARASTSRCATARRSASARSPTTTTTSCARCSTASRTSRAGCASSPPASTSTRWRAGRRPGRAGRGYGVVATAGAPGADRRPRRLRARSRRTAPRSRSRSTRTVTGSASRRSCSRTSPSARAARRHRDASSPPCTRPTTAWRRCFRDSGFAGRGQRRPGRAAASSSPPRWTPPPSRRFEDRDRIAAVAAVAHVLRPASVAIIGASRRPGTVGAARARQPARRRLPRARCTSSTRTADASSAGCPAHRSDRRRARAGRPRRHRRARARAVPQVARECGAAGVRALRRALGGLRRGRRRRRARCRPSCSRPAARSGMRLVGPELPRRAQHGAGVGLNATFAPERAARRADRLRLAERRRSGSRRSPRPRAAASGCRRSSPPATRPTSRATTSCATGSRTRTPTSIAALPRVLRQPAPLRADRPRGRARASRSWPSRAAARPPGARAAASHTGALLAASDVTVDALFAHAGVIRTDTVGRAVRRRRAARPRSRCRAATASRS